MFFLPLSSSQKEIHITSHKERPLPGYREVHLGMPYAVPEHPLLARTVLYPDTISLPSEVFAILSIAA